MSEIKTIVHIEPSERNDGKPSLKVTVNRTGAPPETWYAKAVEIQLESDQP